MSAGTPPLSTPPKPQVKALNCPQCGAAITLRAFGHAVTVVCESCHSILDAKDPNLQILQKFQAITGEAPAAHSAWHARQTSRHRLRSHRLPAPQHRSRRHPLRLARISCSSIRTKAFATSPNTTATGTTSASARNLPVVAVRRPANYLGEIYKHFQTSDATTNYVLGEFPWQVRVGEHAAVTEYVKPPRLLSCGKNVPTKSPGPSANTSTAQTSGSPSICQASRRKPVGVYENQPSPVSENVKGIWARLPRVRHFPARADGLDSTSSRAKARSFESSLLVWTSGEPKGEASFVTDVFDLKGRDLQRGSHNLRQRLQLLDLSQLRADQSGHRPSLGFRPRSQLLLRLRQRRLLVRRQPQGHRRSSPAFPPGHYYLRIEPEVDPTHPPITYSVQVKRDVPVFGFFGIALSGAVASGYRHHLAAPSVSSARAGPKAIIPPMQIGNRSD